MPIKPKSGIQHILTVEQFTPIFLHLPPNQVELANTIKSQALPPAWHNFNDYNHDLAINCLLILLHKHHLIHLENDEFTIDVRIRSLFRKLEARRDSIVSCISVLLWIDRSNVICTDLLLNLCNRSDAAFWDRCGIFEFFFQHDHRLNISDTLKKSGALLHTIFTRSEQLISCVRTLQYSGITIDHAICKTVLDLAQIDSALISSLSKYLGILKYYNELTETSLKDCFHRINAHLDDSQGLSNLLTRLITSAKNLTFVNISQDTRLAIKECKVEAKTLFQLGFTLTDINTWINLNDNLSDIFYFFVVLLSQNFIDTLQALIKTRGTASINLLFCIQEPKIADKLNLLFYLSHDSQPLRDLVLQKICSLADYFFEYGTNEALDEQLTQFLTRQFSLSHQQISLLSQNPKQCELWTNNSGYPLSVLLRIDHDYKTVRAQMIAQEPGNAAFLISDNILERILPAISLPTCDAFNMLSGEISIGMLCYLLLYKMEQLTDLYNFGRAFNTLDLCFNHLHTRLHSANAVFNRRHEFPNNSYL